MASALQEVTQRLTVEHFNFHSVNTFLLALSPLSLLDFMALLLAALSRRRRNFPQTQTLLLELLKLLAALLAKLPALAF